MTRHVVNVCTENAIGRFAAKSAAVLMVAGSPERQGPADRSAGVGALDVMIAERERRVLVLVMKE